MLPKNEKGQILIDLEEQVNHKNFSRYNGGWIRNVTGLNKEETNGYSILGSFVKQGKQWQYPGLYLDCSISGSRKHQEQYHILFLLKEDGDIKIITKKDESEYDDRNWAVDLWSDIEKNIGVEKENPLSNFSDAELLAEIKKRGLK